MNATLHLPASTLVILLLQTIGGSAGIYSGARFHSCRSANSTRGSWQDSPKRAIACQATVAHWPTWKGRVVKAQGKKSGTDPSRGALRKDIKALLSPIDSSPERISDKSIRRQERQALRDPNYARNRLISNLTNTDPEDLFSSGMAGCQLDDNLQSEAGPLTSPTPPTRSTLSSRKPRRRPKMSEGSGAAERFAVTSGDESAHSVLGSKTVGPLVPTR